MKKLINRRSWLSTVTTILAGAFALTVSPLQAKPKTKVTKLDITPVVDSITRNNGQLLASGLATVTIKGQTFTTPFTAPVQLASSAPAKVGDCRILNLRLGPIHLDLLGLVLDTSAICVDITAHSGEGLLGDLLCGVAGLLDGVTPLDQILDGLSAGDLTTLLSGLTDIVNGVLGNLLNGTSLAEIGAGQAGSCAILHLELGPLDLDILGLEVYADNCANGAITVDLTAEHGQGNLLGNLLCELLDGGALTLGATLQSILNQILGLLTQ
jgi:hypothetical protein